LVRFGVGEGKVVTTGPSAVPLTLAAGKIRYFGVSNYKSWRVAEICAICDRLGIDRPVVSQPYYNAMNRMPEVENLPACAYYGSASFPTVRSRAAS